MLIALNTSFSKAVAARKMGISERTLYRYARQYGIVYDEKKKEYKAMNTPNYEIIIPNERSNKEPT